MCQDKNINLQGYHQFVGLNFQRIQQNPTTSPIYYCLLCFGFINHHLRVPLQNLLYLSYLDHILISYNYHKSHHNISSNLKLTNHKVGFIVLYPIYLCLSFIKFNLLSTSKVSQDTLLIRNRNFFDTSQFIESCQVYFSTNE